MVLRTALIWVGLAIVIAVPIVAAARSPLLAWRDPIYILAGFAGVVAMTLMVMQPLLAGGLLPGVRAWRGRRVHRWIGAVLVALVIVHVGSLWATSPPDVIDALLFVSPTPFSAWGVAAMWALFAAALLAATRRRFRLRLKLWRRAHTALALVTVIGTVVHAVLIEGTMETVSKVALCGLLLGVTVKVLYDLRVWRS